MCTESGPKTEVFIVAGFHVPVIPFMDVAGNGGAVEFRHNAAICANVGVI